MKLSTLKQAGYKAYSEAIFHEHSSYNVQKCVYDDYNNKLYYINGHCYEIPTFGDKGEYKYCWQFGVQFNFEDGNVFDVIYCDNSDIEIVEAFFYKMFNKMGCVAYD